MTSYGFLDFRDDELVGTKCNEEYLKVAGKNWTLPETKRKAYDFIDQYNSDTDYDLSSYFGELMKLTGKF